MRTLGRISLQTLKNDKSRLKISGEKWYIVAYRCGLWDKTVPLLYGQYNVTKDAKNRLGIPAEVRRGIDPEKDGNAFFVVTGDNGKLWLYTEKAYDAMGKERPPELAPPDERLDFDHLHYALSEKVEWDQQGRILLPTEDVKETKTGNELTLIGSRDHLEIWNRTEWEEHRKDLRAKRKEISLRGKQSSQNQGVQGT